MALKESLSFLIKEELKVGIRENVTCEYVTLSRSSISKKVMKGK